MNCSIFIYSWDKVKAIWPVVKYCFDTYWKDCPYPIYMTSNKVETPFLSIKVGEIDNWTFMMKRALKYIKTPYIIFTLDDYWFNKQINTSKIVELVNLAEKNNIDYIKLFPSNITTYSINHLKEIKEYALDFQYKTGLNVSIWKKETLEKLLFSFENIWEFEMNSYLRTESLQKYCCVTEDIYIGVYGHFFNTDEAILNKGKITNFAKKFIEENKIQLNESLETIT